jgi:eukaryotic-like serine/threonine-protein kinase
MPFGKRVLGMGKVLLLVGALGATFLTSALVAMRMALRASDVEVPTLVGVPVADASETAAAAGLSLRIDPSPRPDERIAAGSIVQQDPAPGVEARRQRTVRVWVSSGPATTIVPTLLGQTEGTARTRVVEDGLEIAAFSEFRSPDYAANAIVAQDPAPAALAPQVSLLLNRGEQSTTYVMPDLIGTDGEHASETLRTRGFRVSIVGSQPYAGVPPGTVVRQRPAGGFRVGPADSISLEVSQ